MKNGHGMFRKQLVDSFFCLNNSESIKHLYRNFVLNYVTTNMITVDRCVNLISTPNLSSKIVEVFTRISKATEAFISIYFKNVE